MLKPPYRRYERLHVYHLDITYVPEVDDPDFIGAWQEGETIVLFFHRDKSALMAALCNEYNSSIVYQAELGYSDWESGVEVTPFAIGNFRIAPIWDSAAADIVLDPSVVFGSGFHPTTRLCLETLLSLLNEINPPIHSALDLGCGTGVLAIAAAAKGVKNITAVDYNSLACRVAEANVLRNAVSDSVTVQQMDLKKDSPDTHGIDLVIANLHHELLLELFKRDSFWKSRYYLLSGVFISREELLLAALPEKAPRFIERRSLNRWAAWLLDNQK